MARGHHDGAALSLFIALWLGVLRPVLRNLAE